MQNNIVKKPVLSPTVALSKAQAYCVYQERCQSEARTKLYTWGLWKNDVENILTQLIADGFINEERFSILYAGGKFRIKNWGKAKIKAALKQKGVTDYCIKKALVEIDDTEYQNTLKKLIVKKSKELKEKNKSSLRLKLSAYAISKGFEREVVWDIINNLLNT